MVQSNADSFLYVFMMTITGMMTERETERARHTPRPTEILLLLLWLLLQLHLIPSQNETRLKCLFPALSSLFTHSSSSLEKKTHIHAHIYAHTYKVYDDSSKKFSRMECVNTPFYQGESLVPLFPFPQVSYNNSCRFLCLCVLTVDIIVSRCLLLFAHGEIITIIQNPST